MKLARQAGAKACKAKARELNYERTSQNYLQLPRHENNLRSINGYIDKEGVYEQCGI